MNAQATEYNTAGIDIGTTYSTISYYSVGRTIETGKEASIDGSDTPYVPSMVCNQDHVVVGSDAYRTRYRNRTSTIYDSKRFIGKRFTDESVQEIIHNYAYQIVEGENNRAAFRVEWQGKEEIVYPEQVYAMIINYLCDLVEKKTRRRIEFLVVSVPVNFNADQRACTESAVQLAHRTMLAMIDEPSAAALSFTSRNVEDNKTILVYDLGGGTFDVSIMRKLPTEYKVLGVDGDSHFGGRDLDKIIFDEIVRQIRAQDAHFELTDAFKERINAECEKLKINLSTTRENGATHTLLLGDGDYEIELGYNELEHLFVPLLEPTMDRLRSCLDACHLTPNDIDHVILIGGSSNWPGVSRIIEQMFDREKILGSDDPRLAVSRGTLIYASTRFNAGLVTPVMEVRMLPEANAGMVVPLDDDQAAANPTAEIPTDEGLPMPLGKTVVRQTAPLSDSDRGLVVPTKEAIQLDSITDEEDEEEKEEPSKPVMAPPTDPTSLTSSLGQNPEHVNSMMVTPPKAASQPPIDSGTMIRNSATGSHAQAIVNSIRHENPDPNPNPNPNSPDSSLVVTDSSLSLSTSTSGVPPPPPIPPMIQPPSPPPIIQPPPVDRFWLKLQPGLNYLKVIANGQFVMQRNDTITWSHDLDGRDCELIEVDQSNVIVSDKLHIDLDGQEYDFKGKQLKLCIERGDLIIRCSEQIRQIGPKPNPSNPPDLGTSLESIDAIAPPLPVNPVLPLDIGVEVRSGRMSVIIPKNTPLPAVGEKMFQANAGSPTVIETQLYQGSNLAECVKNHELGLLKASGLMPSSNGRAQIAVKVKVSVEGLLDLSYYQLGGKECRCAVYHNVVLDDQLLQELRMKVDEWRQNGSLMQRHKLIYLDTEELLKSYKHVNGDDQRYEQWRERLRETRVRVPSEVTNGLIQHMEDLREQLRRELQLQN